MLVDQSKEPGSEISRILGGWNLADSAAAGAADPNLLDPNTPGALEGWKPRSLYWDIHMTVSVGSFVCAFLETQELAV